MYIVPEYEFQGFKQAYMLCKNIKCALIVADHSCRNEYSFGN